MTRLRRYALGALWLIVAQLALAQDAPVCAPPAPPATPAELQAAAAQASDRGFLWRITKGGHSSWLYGTLHLGSPATAQPGPAVRAALDRSDLLALEIDLQDPQMLQRLVRSLQAGIAARPLPAALAARLNAQAAAACLPAGALQGVPPLLQLTQLSALAARRDGLDPAYGVDALLGARAHAANQPVLSLETPEAQVALLTGFTEAEERELIREGLDDLESGRARQLLKRTADVWAESRLGELERYAQWCDCERTAHERRYMKRLLDERNLGMAATVARVHAEGRRLFVAVGSLHMIGPHGLPELLRAQGFELERITPP